MGQSRVQYRELGHRSVACCMEDNTMNRPCNSTCSLWFNLPLRYLTEAGNSEPVGPSRGEGTYRVEQFCSSPSLAGTAAERLRPAEYTNENASHVPYVGHRPLILLTDRMATFSLSINKFPLNNMIMKAAGSSFDWLLLRLPCHSSSAGRTKPSAISNGRFHEQNAWKETNKSLPKIGKK